MQRYRYFELVLFDQLQEYCRQLIVGALVQVRLQSQCALDLEGALQQCRDVDQS